MHGDHRLRTLTLVNATTSGALAPLNTLWALYLLRTGKPSAALRYAEAAVDHTARSRTIVRPRAWGRST
ncbi:hypothetical protein ACH4L5_05205 [Streptomyces sp. NPDC017405]|uniref:hypothetical protein n=1 Tax=unclassified Streptomyces TaxID=2593676 RepID=UPI00378BAD5C